VGLYILLNEKEKKIKTPSVEYYSFSKYMNKKKKCPLFSFF